MCVPFYVGSACQACAATIYRWCKVEHTNWSVAAFFALGVGTAALAFFKVENKWWFLCATLGFMYIEAAFGMITSWMKNAYQLQQEAPQQLQQQEAPQQEQQQEAPPQQQEAPQQQQQQERNDAAGVNVVVE